MEPGRKVGGVISIKHVYEIAKYKNEELNCASYTLKEMCQNVINVANRAGIKIVHNDLNPAELREFLDERKRHEEIELKQVAEKRAAKLMRASTAAATAAATKK
jgi:large subunit ribosomal protein L11